MNEQPTVRDLVNDYLALREAEHASGRLKAAFLDRLHRYLGEFAAKFGDQDATTIRPSHLTTWLLSHPGWRSPHTVMNAARCVRGLFAWAEGDDLIPKDPIRRFKPCWDTPQPRGAIKPEEYAAIMKAARKGPRRPSRARFREGMFFLSQTGARTSEFRSARWEQLDWQARLLHMQTGKTTGKTGRARLIALSPALLRLLWRIHRRAGRPTEGTIFLNSRDRPWGKEAFSDLFKSFAKLAGVDRPGISPYCLRHGFCVKGLENGVGERQIADAMGHSTTRYIGWYGQGTKGNAEYLRGVLEQIHQNPAQRPEEKKP